MKKSFFLLCLNFVHRWFLSAPAVTGPPIPIPSPKGDKYGRTSVLPYLEAFHYGNEQDQEDVYFTEHDVNRK